jgi:hypothetical protein
MNISEVIVENITNFVNTTDIITQAEGISINPILLLIFGIILVICMAGAAFG